MNKTLKISFSLKNTYRVNGVLFSLKQIPLVKRLLPATLYQVKGLKIFANILSVLWEIVSVFLGDELYEILESIKNGTLYNGKEAEKLLDNIGITCNKNTIPFDPASPFVTSGIRLGTPAATTRGFKEEDFKEVASIMGLVLNNPEDTDKHAEAAKRVAALCAKYPLYTNL